MNERQIIEEHKEILKLLQKLVDGYGMKDMKVDFEPGADAILKKRRLDFLAAYGLVETIDPKENRFIVGLSPMILSYSLDIDC